MCWNKQRPENQWLGNETELAFELKIDLELRSDIENQKAQFDIGIEWN